MPGYSLVPVDHQRDFDGYTLVPVDYDPFAADGPIRQARTQPASQPQPNAGFDQPPSAPQTPGSAPPLPPIVPNDGQGPSVPQPPGQDLHSQYAEIGFESADRAWDAALKEMQDLGAQYYPNEAKSSSFIPELGVQIFKRNGLYYYDRIARGYQERALGGGVAFDDSGAVARGHMHWDNQRESGGDRDNAQAYTQQTPNYNAWVGSWYGFYKYWHNGKPTESRMPDWNRCKY